MTMHIVYMTFMLIYKIINPCVKESTCCTVGLLCTEMGMGGDSSMGNPWEWE